MERFYRFVEMEISKVFKLPIQKIITEDSDLEIESELSLIFDITGLYY